MPNNVRCCPDCGSNRFSWITEYTETGNIVDSERGSNYRQPNGAPEPLGPYETHVDCLECGSAWATDDLISQDEAYHDESLSSEWMIEYEPSSQQTLEDDQDNA